jgi:heavy metal translocating P-type ATPase
MTATTPASPGEQPPLAALAALGGVAAGASAWAFGSPEVARACWALTTLALLVPLSVSVVRSLAQRDFGVDVLALLSMAGAVAVGQYLAGAIIAVMLAGGNALEGFARSRARRDLSMLVSRTPTTANLLRGGEIVSLRADAVTVGDRLVVRSGEVVPTDGTVLSDDAVLDTAALTGEPLPVHVLRGADVASGSVNAGAPIEIAATHPAGESTFAALVRLVKSAESAQAPFVRMADRYAGWFLPVALSLAALGWALSGDPVRAVAVLVIATPCPLILAAPVALVSAVSRTARAGVIVKGAPVIETLAGTRTVLLDKTGTLTLGTPAVEGVEPVAGIDEAELLRLTASADQASPHIIAQAIVAEARTRGLALTFPTMPDETPGQGLIGTVAGHRVAVGSAAFVNRLGYTPAAADPTPGVVDVQVVIDDAIAGVIRVTDQLRAESSGLVGRLRAVGVDRVLLVTGDRRPFAEKVAAATGVDHVYAEMTATAKLDLVRAIRAGTPQGGVAMVGDGINDAPALAQADTGIAIGATATVATQTADAVIVSDRVDRVVDAIRISRRSMHIARQSVIAGLGLSVLGMLLALAGLLPPIAGALAQEAIDAAVILNALRALSSR